MQKIEPDNYPAVGFFGGKDRIEWEYGLLIITYLINNSDNRDPLNPEKMGIYIRLLSSIQHTGLLLYILDLVEKIYGNDASKMLVREIKRSDWVLMNQLYEEHKKGIRNRDECLNKIFELGE